MRYRESHRPPPETVAGTPPPRALGWIDSRGFFSYSSIITRVMMNFIFISIFSRTS